MAARGAPGRRPDTIVVSALATVSAVALGPVLLTPVKEGVDWLRGYPYWLQRAALAPEAPPSGGLAAWQVGYGPSMVKQFSSPERFASFQVVSTSGEVAFEGGPPVREIRTDTLAAVRTVWIGDFTPLRTTGRYCIVSDNGISRYPFDVGQRVFDAAVRAVQRAFYYQRAFTEIDAEHAQGPWVHATDAALAPPGVVKGWHDAGDFSLYSASTNVGCYWPPPISRPRRTTPASPNAGTACPTCWTRRDEGRSGWLSVQASGGGSHNTACQERYGRYGTNWPERMASYRLGEVGTIATGSAVGTLAFASVLYRPLDSTFVERLLAGCKGRLPLPPRAPGREQRWPHLPSNAPGWGRDVGLDVLMYAAAGLLLATGDRRFRVDFEESYQPLQNDPSYRRNNVYAALLYCVLQPATRSGSGPSAWSSDAAPRRCAGTASATPSGGQVVPSGASLRPASSGPPASAPRLASRTRSGRPPTASRCWPTCTMRWAGTTHRWSMWPVYPASHAGAATPSITGWRRSTPDHSSFPGRWLEAPIAAPEPGDISVPHGRPVASWGYWGGPPMPRDASTPLEGRYTDNDSWSTNELDIDWQAVTLYNLYFARWWAAGRPDARRSAVRTKLRVEGVHEVPLGIPVLFAALLVYC
jgi:hypothetical protein